jgi:hypothetical protein
MLLSTTTAGGIALPPSIEKKTLPQRTYLRDCDSKITADEVAEVR